MKEYIKPEMKVEEFDIEDVIATSEFNPETKMYNADEGIKDENDLLTN